MQVLSSSCKSCQPVNVQFRDRLRCLWKKITSCKNLTSFDVAALKHDRKTHPKKATNHRDEPQWEGLKAEQYHLKHDVEKGKQDTMKLEALYNSWIEYKDYPLLVFRKHIYQEDKRRKFEAYCEVQVEKKKKKKKEIDSIASGFCILSLYWPFGYDRVVLVKRLRHSFS